MNSGIYIITCLINNKIYVGRAVNWRNRLAVHKTELIQNKHKNQHLQNAFNKYSVNNFTFELLEEYEEKFLCSMENYWCNLLNTHNRKFGYNIEPTSPFGKTTTSEETKLKQSKARVGTPKAQKKIDLEESLRYKVIQYDLEGNFIKIWKNLNEICDYYQLFPECIRMCFKNNNKSSGGYRWKKYKENYEIKLDKYSKHLNGYNIKIKKLYQYNLNGKFIKEWDSSDKKWKSSVFKLPSIRYKIKKSNSIYKNYYWSYTKYNDSEELVSVFSLKKLEEELKIKGL